MYLEMKDYQKASTFARSYTKTKGKDKGKVGVSRAYINELIADERINPGTTGLDVLHIDGNYFVKKSTTVR
jgi:hypothetical protein